MLPLELVSAFTVMVQMMTHERTMMRRPASNDKCAYPVTQVVKRVLRELAEKPYMM